MQSCERMALDLAKGLYKIDVKQHLPGRLNLWADALSRFVAARERGHRAAGVALRRARASGAPGCRVVSSGWRSAGRLIRWLLFETLACAVGAALLGFQAGLVRRDAVTIDATSVARSVAGIGAIAGAAPGAARAWRSRSLLREGPAVRRSASAVCVAGASVSSACARFRGSGTQSAGVDTFGVRRPTAPRLGAWN